MSIAVVDAAIVVDLICDFPAAGGFRGAISTATALAAPAHLDAEVLSALARLQRGGGLTQAAERLEALASLPVRRLPLEPLLAPAWALMDRIAIRDALYVALAAALDATLITTDRRLRGAAKGLVDVAEPVG